MLKIPLPLVATADVPVRGLVLVIVLVGLATARINDTIKTMPHKIVFSTLLFHIGFFVVLCCRFALLRFALHLFLNPRVQHGGERC